MIRPSATVKREAISAEIQRRGLSCTRQGNTWRISGSGIDILTTDLAYIEPSQLRPAGWELQRV